MKSFAHQTSLTRHFFIGVHAPRQESETSCIYMLGGGGVDFASFCDFSIGLKNTSDSVYFWFSILFHIPDINKR